MTLNISFYFTWQCPQCWFPADLGASRRGLCRRTATDGNGAQTVCNTPIDAVADAVVSVSGMHDISVCNKCRLSTTVIVDALGFQWCDKCGDVRDISNILKRASMPMLLPLWAE